MSDRRGRTRKRKDAHLASCAELEIKTEPKQAKLVPSGSRSILTCCLKECSQPIASPERDGRVEVKAGLPEKAGKLFFSKCSVAWGRGGEAVFHDGCWISVCRNARARSKSRMTLSMPEEEKRLIKEASKTAEFHDSAAIMAEKAAKIANLIRGAKHCVAFTGAGISTSAGIGDYRGKEGKWTEMDREEAASSLAAKEDVVTEGLGETDEEGVPYEQLRPTYTHEALAKLTEMGLLKHIISQNGDGLHGLSGVPYSSLSELHGNVFLETCEKCHHPYYRPFYVMDDSASLYYEEMEESGSSTVKKPRHALKCVQCGFTHRTGRCCTQPSGCSGYLKDSIINFGDLLEETILETATQHAKRSDLCLSLGSTMCVTPACELVEMGQEPLRLVIVNRQKTSLDGLCSKQSKNDKELGVRAFGDCDRVMQEVMTNLLSTEEHEMWVAGCPTRKKLYDSLRKSD